MKVKVRGLRKFRYGGSECGRSEVSKASGRTVAHVHTSRVALLRRNGQETKQERREGDFICLCPHVLPPAAGRPPPPRASSWVPSQHVAGPLPTFLPSLWLLSAPGQSQVSRPST